MRAERFIVLLATLCAGCKGALVIPCIESNVCVRSGAGGFCDSSPSSTKKFCSFSDAACMSGRRWDPTAGDSLGGTCVGMSLADGSTPMPDMAAAMDDMAGLGSWTAQTSGVPNWLFAVWGSGPLDVYAGGQIPKSVLHSGDRGGTWTQQFLPMAGTDIAAIGGTGPTDVYAAGDSGIMFHGDGTALGWKLIASPTTSNINSIRGIGGDLWAVGDAGTVLHKLGANPWQLVNTVPMACQETLHDVFGLDKLNVYVVGYKGVICHTTDGGATWTPQSTGDTKNHAGIWGTDKSNLYIASDAGTIYHTKDGGKTWPADITPTTQDLLSLWGSGPKDIYAAGGNPNPAILHYDGTRWTLQTSPAMDGLSAIWGSDAANIFVVGINGVIMHGP